MCACGCGGAVHCNPNSELGGRKYVWNCYQLNFVPFLAYNFIGLKVIWSISPTLLSCCAETRLTDPKPELWFEHVSQRNPSWVRFTCCGCFSFAYLFLKCTFGSSSVGSKVFFSSSSSILKMSLKPHGLQEVWAASHFSWGWNLKLELF